MSPTDGIEQSFPAFGGGRESIDIAQTALKSAEELCNVKDPEIEPFRSKYKARAVLKAAKDELLAFDWGSDNVASTASLALIDYRLGVIALAVEEPSAAQEALESCADVFFEGVVHNVAEEAGEEHEAEDEDDTTRAHAAQIPVPVESPAGMASPTPLAWEYPVEAADTLTQLGWRWSGRGCPQRSLLYLLSSVSFLRDASSSLSSSLIETPSVEETLAQKKKTSGNSDANDDLGDHINPELHVEGETGIGCSNDDQEQPPPPPPSPTPVAKPEDATITQDGDVSRAQRRTKLESQLTHGFYYLAQAYAAKDVELSAKYCTLTLQRQLDASQRGQGNSVSFDPGDWSRNACFLAEYYSGLGLFQAAGKCLLAAQVVLSGRTSEDGPQATPKGLTVKHASDGIITTAATTTTDNNNNINNDNRNTCGNEEDEKKESDAAGAISIQHDRKTAAVPKLLASTTATGVAATKSTVDGDNKDGTNTQIDPARTEEVNPPSPPPQTTSHRRQMQEAVEPQQEGEDQSEGNEVTVPQTAVAMAAATAGSEKGPSATMTASRAAKGEGSGGNEDKNSTIEETGEERWREQLADVDRHMARLYIAVLQQKHNVRILGRREAGTGQVKGTGASLAGEDDGENPVGFPSLATGELPLCNPSTVADDFEAVREVFKKAKSHTDRALRHYVLDGFVTANVALHQGLSRAYLYLSTFEKDGKRQQAMCSRRAQSLEPLLAVLASKVYSHLHKELSFELGEIYQDLAELKVARIMEKRNAAIGRGPAVADIRATNKLLQRAIGFFSHFIAMYHGDGNPSAAVPAGSPSQPRQDMDAAEAPGYLHARFMRARLYGKLQFAESARALQALRWSLAEFTWLVENAAGHLKTARASDPTLFEQELYLAGEMAQLQSRNIANLERQHENEQ